MYMLIALKSGEKFVSEFTKLRSPQKYAQQVFSGQKVMNVWRVEALTHPASGERVLIRSRKIVPGEAIAYIEQVTPKPGLNEVHEHEYKVENFEPYLVIQRGKGGMHVFLDNEDLPDGAVPGIEYPVHLDERRKKYVIVTAADAENNVAEVRFEITARVSSQWVPAGTDDDDDDE